MAEDTPFPINRAAFCGLLAMVVGLGIARFGYAPMVPALIGAGWFSASAAFWLGAANLLGYFLGAGAARSWRGPLHVRATITGLMGVTALCLLGSAWRAGVPYFAALRLVSGMTGGALMVLMAAAVVGRAPPARRGRAGGITFAGMGLGITLSGVLIPRLLPLGLPATWLVLGGVGLLGTVLVGAFMPDAVLAPVPRSAGLGLRRPVLLLFAGYSLCALGFVPHMLFLPSFVALRLGHGVAAGATIAAIMGLAAACGPPVLGRFADRFGFLATLGCGYLVMAIAVALPLFTGNLVLLGVSALGVGAVALGAVMLTSGALAGMVPPARLAGTWGLATMIYALAQALVAAGFSQIFHLTDSYRPLFGVGAVAVVISAMLVVLASRARRAEVIAR